MNYKTGKVLEEIKEALEELGRFCNNDVQLANKIKANKSEYNWTSKLYELTRKVEKLLQTID